jgi:hypothetical protein
LLRDRWGDEIITQECAAELAIAAVGFAEKGEGWRVAGKIVFKKVVPLAGWAVIGYDVVKAYNTC